MIIDLWWHTHKEKSNLISPKSHYIFEEDGTGDDRGCRTWPNFWSSRFRWGFIFFLLMFSWCLQVCVDYTTGSVVYCAPYRVSDSSTVTSLPLHIPTPLPVSWALSTYIHIYTYVYLYIYIYIVPQTGWSMWVERQYPILRDRRIQPSWVRTPVESNNDLKCMSVAS